jgi:hypothetical protein
MFEDFFRPQKEELFQEWDAVSAREKRSRTVFAQETIKPDEVARELEAVRSAIGAGVDVAGFTAEVLRAHGAAVKEDGATTADLSETPRALREAVGGVKQFTARFAKPVEENELYLTRTHPIVEGLATYVMDTALDPVGEGVARRAGVIRTRAVARRTTVLLLRLRYHIVTRRGDEATPLLAEDTQLLAFEGSPEAPSWLPVETAERLIQAMPDANVAADIATNTLRRIIEGFGALRPKLDEVAVQRGQELLDAHRRVRTAAAHKGVRYDVEPQLPPDVLGVYTFLPLQPG